MGALGAAIMVGALGSALLFGLTVEMGRRGERLMTLLDLRALPPQPPLPKPHVERPQPRKASGRAAPRNLRNKATDIVVPPPPTPLPVPPTVVAAVKPGEGAAAAAGASDLPGPGEGAGGLGDGTGSGDHGEGEGDGGDVPPRHIKGRLKISDLPAELVQAGAGGTVGVRYDVEPDGRVGDCRVTASSGNAELDRLTCQLIQQRFRFDPLHDRYGRAARSTIEERHSWEVDRRTDARTGE